MTLILGLALYVLGATVLYMTLISQTATPIQDKLANEQQLTDSGYGRENEQQAYACSLKKNPMLRNEFENAVRVKHDSVGHYNYLADTSTTSTSDIRCRARCAGGGNVTWCINVYNPVDDIEVCIGGGLLINATDAAKNLNLPSYFDTQTGANGELHVKNLPVYFSDSYLTCTVHTETCTNKSFTTLLVRFYSREKNIDPCLEFDLAEQITSEICALNLSQVQGIYKALRDEENRDYQFPDPTDYGAQTFDVRGENPEINWFIGGQMYRLNVLQPYFGQRLSNVTPDILTWCIHPLSTTTNIYGCINSTHRWSTPNFKALGFLDMMSLKNDTTSPSYRQGNLILDLSNSCHLSALKGAFVSCTIRVPDNTTMGVYFQLNLEESTGSTLLGISPQSEAFLVEGQGKNFTCESKGDSLVGFPWFRVKNGHSDLIDEPDYATLKTNNTVYQLRYREEDTKGCNFSFGQHFRFSYDTCVLVFVTPTVDDTGEYKCAAGTDDNGSAIYINVVFTELPMEETLVTKGQSSQLTCEMKAPSNSSIYWTHKQVNKKMCRVISLNETLVNIEMTPCDTTAVVYQREKVIDDKYSVYHLELQIPEASFDHIGEYSCNVEYPAGPLKQMYLIQQHSSLFIKT